MNDKKFDSLKRLKTPESWIDNALSIPNKKAPQPAFFIRYSRQLVAAACLVLVCAVSLFVVLQKNDDKILVIDPDVNITHTENQSGTEENNVADNKQNGTSASATESKKQNGDAPFESTESTNRTDSTKATEKPTRPKGDKEENQDKTEKPTSKPVAPTVFETDAPEKPTDYEEDIYPTEGDGSGWDDDPMIPGAPPSTETPSVSPKPDLAAISQYREVHDYCEIVDYIETKWLTGNGNVYCVIKKAGLDGSWFGGDDLLAPEHLCTIWKEENGYTYFAYSIKNTYNITEDGKYLYVIYNDKTHAFFSKYIYVYANN